MAKYTSINEAIRDKIDYVIELDELDAKDYPYSSDASVSLAQLGALIDSSETINPESTIADALGSFIDIVISNVYGITIDDGGRQK